MSIDGLQDPWRSFLLEFDAQLTEPTELHCLGGFVVAECYGLSRPTVDIDILESRGADLATITALAGRNSALHKRHKIYIDVVTVAEVPDNYEDRLIAAPAASFVNLRLLLFERHDLVLAKLTRNNDRDRADVSAIAAVIGLDVDVLRTRYMQELRYKLGRPEREDLTLSLWVEIVEASTKGTDA